MFFRAKKSAFPFKVALQLVSLEMPAANQQQNDL